MSSVVLLEPHHDDAVLFASYTILRLKPVVITVFGHAVAQERYGISAMMRDNENIEAMQVLEPSAWRSWDHSDINPNEEQIIDSMLRLNTVVHPKEVWSPMFELDGHEQHNLVARCAEIVYPGRVRYYATYSRGSRRTTTEHEVIPKPHWPALKLRAMSCYASQINLGDCQSWFAADEMLREWVA